MSGFDLCIPRNETARPCNINLSPMFQNHVSVSGLYIFDPALLDLEVAIAKNVIYFPRNE